MYTVNLKINQNSIMIYEIDEKKTICTCYKSQRGNLSVFKEKIVQAKIV